MMIPKDTVDADLKEYIFQYIADHQGAQIYDCCARSSPLDVIPGPDRLATVSALTVWLIDNGYVVQKGRWLYACAPGMGATK